MIGSMDWFKFQATVNQIANDGRSQKWLTFCRPQGEIAKVS